MRQLVLADDLGDFGEAVGRIARRLQKLAIRGADRAWRELRDPGLVGETLCQLDALISGAPALFGGEQPREVALRIAGVERLHDAEQIGRASCRERVCPYV